jgi:hypothetical protein
LALEVVDPKFDAAAFEKIAKESGALEVSEVEL